jgi:helicase
MRLNDLERQGIPPRIIERWIERQGESLLPVQSKAVRKGILGQYGSCEQKEIKMIISAPTSSGKSFCAEMAAIKSLTGRKRVVMLFPLKSLAEEKYRLFENTYESLGIKCLIVTGDHPENDHRFKSGDYHIAICIYEKFDQYLTSSLDGLRNIGLVVVDEIQTVAEPIRGAILERLLTKIKASIYSPSIVGLSAVIGDDTSSAGKLADWLEAELVEERMRPVELIRGVAAEGSLRYRLYNSGSDGVEPFTRIDEGESAFENFIEQLKTEKGSTLVFLKSRIETVNNAFRLASATGWSEAKEAVTTLENEEPSFLIRSLCRVLSRGVAFHNSDLSQYQRYIVEQSFINKEVKVIFSTTTLAMGVNLSADNVYLETVKYSFGTYNGKPTLVPVSRSEFDNMTGRAGRFGGCHYNGKQKPGRAVVLAHSEFDRDVLWGSYIAAEQPEKLHSAFKSMPSVDWLLNMIACGLLLDKSEKAIANLMGYTFYATDQKLLPDDEFELAFERLVDEQLVTVSTDEKLTLTPLGRAVARCGLSVSEAIYFRRILEIRIPESDFGWMALALSSPEWDLPPSILNRAEQSQNLPVKMLYQYYDHLADDATWLLGNRVGREPLSYRKAAALKGLLLLEQWRNLVELEKLEQRFQMHLGQIVSLGETIAHRLRSLAGIMSLSEHNSSLAKRLNRLAFSIYRGLPVEMSKIHDNFKDILNRSDFGLLQKMGVSELEKFCRMTPEGLEKTFSSKRKLRQINDKIKILKEEVEMRSGTVTSPVTQSGIAPVLFAQPEIIEIDGSYEKERYLVKINGLPVHLTGKSFKYFIKLAWSRLNGDSGWIYKEEIEHGFNQARYLYRMKGEINRGLNGEWPIVENNRLGYYRLNADPSKIRINIDNLKNHPDYEVRALIGGQESTQLN